MNILLHICCAPCALAAIDEIIKDGHKLAGFFYNPNVHPYSEYLKRIGEVEKLSKQLSIPVNCGDYDVEYFFQNIVYNEPKDIRCPVCWWIRIKRAAEFAKAGGFDAFTTTLLGSPYQDQAAIKEIGEDIARRLGIKFYYKDFRPNFKAAHDKARAQGIYCQKYCGCLYSEKERVENKDQGARHKGQGKEKTQE
jgi:predicted adenine nucleotide alpha hydrolase (AANH) superfamily ATPase